ncbi:MAG: glycosyltransferase family 4 protein [Gemmatimonadaceae bacterium]
MLGHPYPSDPTALSTPLTILHLLAPAPVGGLETVVSMLARAQSRAGHRVIVAPTLSAQDDGKGFLASLAGSRVEIIPLTVARRSYLRECRLIRKLCADKHVSVVHTHGYRSDIVGGMAGRSEGLPIVTTVHGFTGGSLKNRTFEALQRRAFERFDAVVVVSQPQAAFLRASGVPETRTHIIANALAAHPNPVDRAAARLALGLAPEGLVAGWVGRVSIEKGVDVFIDAIHAIGDRVIRATIVGDGPERSAQEARAESLAPGRFQWLGTVPDAARYFAAFDVFVMSSRAEGLPMVLLEAMAARVPIVTTAVGGIPDLLSPAEGVLVAADDPRALAAAIRATIDDPGAASERAQAGQQRQRSEYDVAPWAERYEELYRHLIGARARGGSHS